MSHYCAISNEHKLLTVSVSNSKNRRAAFPDKCYYTQNVGILKAVIGRTNAELSSLCYILPLQHLTTVCNPASFPLCCSVQMSSVIMIAQPAPGPNKKKHIYDFGTTILKANLTVKIICNSVCSISTCASSRVKSIEIC